MSLIGKAVIINPSIVDKDYVGDVFINDEMKEMIGQIMVVSSIAHHFTGYEDTVYHLEGDTDNWGWPEGSLIEIKHQEDTFTRIDVTEFSNLLVKSGITRLTLRYSTELHTMTCFIANFDGHSAQQFINNTFPKDYVDGFNLGTSYCAERKDVDKMSLISDHYTFKKGFVDGFDVMKFAKENSI